MISSIKNQTWVYVIVQDPGSNEQFLGQYDPENKLSFIPFFETKEDAQQCLPNLSREISKIYEVQAIIYEDLVHYSKENDSHLSLLNGLGKILDTAKP
jgi:hypothetical protein